MNKEMIISVNAYEKRVAILEEGVVVEFYVERADDSKAVVGNIYKGKVRKVLPGMQSAFVDIGLERDAFLYVGDFFEETEEDLDTTESVTRLRPERAERPSEPPRRDAEGRRGGRERRFDQPAERPAVAEPRGDAALEPEETTALSSAPESGDPAERSVETQSPEAGLATPLLQSILESSQVPQFERVSDDLESAPASQAAPPADSLTSVAGRLELEPAAPADRGEPEAAPGPARERRRGRRKEVIGEEKKKPARRRSKKAEEEVASLVAAELPPSDVPPVVEARFERVLDDEDYGEEAGDFLKDALIQQKIIAQTRIEEIETKPDAPADELSPAPVDERPAVEPLTLGYEQVGEPADMDSTPVAFPEEPAAADAAAMTEAVADENAPSPAMGELAGPAASSADDPGEAAADEDEPSDAAQLQARLPQSEFPPRRGRRGRRRGGRGAGAPGDEAADPEDRSDSPDDDASDDAAPEAEMALKAELAGHHAENGSAKSVPEESPVIIREIPVSAEALALQEPPLPEPRAEARSAREPRPSPRAPRDDRRDEPRKDDRKDDRRDLDAPRRPTAISELLREGQEIIVQIAKEPIGLKGARITSYVSLPGRYLVYLPTISHIGVSRKISTEQERLRLKRTMTMLREREGVTGGFIVRTACEGRSEQDLCDDMLYLARTWRDIRRRSEQARSGTALCRELDLVQRLLRDHMSSDFSVIRVDDPGEYANIVDFINRFQPKLVDRVRLYTRNRPIFEEYNIQPEIEAALKPRVWLKSGGFIVINQTEALVAIDVNTGKFVGKSNRLEDTIARTNIEAAAEIVRQIRLRDLGGIIVLDFIDMEDRRNRQKVMQVLEQAMKSDRSPSKITAFNDFGLVAITRKRVRQSLERILSEPCHYCGGSGMIKSAQTMCYEILSDAKHLAKEKAAAGQVISEVTLRVSPQVAEALRGPELRAMREIEFSFGAPVTLHSDPHIHQERFDFAFL